MLKGVISIKGYIEERTLELAKYLLEYKLDIRKLSKKFGLSYSTVRNDLKVRLAELRPELFERVEKHLESIKIGRSK